MIPKNGNKVIAIDGPAGSGKSTVSRMLAARIGFDYLDTGALYRAVALKLMRDGVNETADDAALSTVLTKTSIEYRDAVVYLDGEDVSSEIRTPEVGRFSSIFSARKPVRDYLLSIQRNAALTDGIVAEGRDMATVVFPDAWKKFYLTADERTRAERRYAQMKKNNLDVTMEHAARDVASRDERDTSRSIAPLVMADSAVEIDTTNLTIDETILRMLKEL